MNDLVRESYNKVADNYSANRDQFKNDQYLEQLAARLKPGATILDIGCGAGIPIDKYLIDRGFKIIGLDISAKQIELAKNNFPQSDYRVEDMSKLKKEEYRVDAVISFYAIFHTPKKQHQLIFEKINSFLVPGGLILVTMGASEWEGSEQFHGAKMWWSHFGQEKNVELVKKAGFDILTADVDTSGGENHLVILAIKK